MAVRRLLIYCMNVEETTSCLINNYLEPQLLNELRLPVWLLMVKMSSLSYWVTLGNIPQSTTEGANRMCGENELYSIKM